MQKNFINKGFALTIIILFIGMSITPSTGILIKKSSFSAFNYSDICRRKLYK